MRIKSAFAMLLAAVSFSASAVIPADAQVELIEFYNKSLDHYFVTANLAEANDLDTGVHVGWARTGYRFPVIKIGSTQPATTSTCRFYGRPEAKIDSHFYSSKSIECDDVKKKFPEAWQFEADEVFRAFAVDPNTGKCPTDTGPVYRLWNNRADVNHRYTDQISVYNEMVAKGYIPEGDGNPLLPVAFCQPSGNSVVPPPPAGSPSCTLSAATATPAIGTVQTLTATCTGTPTSYTWTGCASVGLPNTCQATRATVGAANYTVRATNAAGTGAAVTMTLTWGGTPGVVPQCTISISNTTPTTGSSIILTANCSQTPTRYDWLECNYYFAGICQALPGCPLTSTTCSVSQSTAGFARYGVHGTNSAGAGPNVTVEAEWKGGGGGGGGGGAVPACTIFASDNFPPLGTPLNLTASCSNSPTSFSWSGNGVACGSQSVCQTILNSPGPQTYTLIGGNSSGSGAPTQITVNWGGSPGPPVPVCTLSSNVGLTPTVGQTALISSNCTNAPTSFAWVNCTSTTASCSDAPSTTGPKTYYLTATNSAGPSVQTSLTLNWQPAPTAAPTCALSSNNNSPFTGQSITLSSNCTQSPTSYTWTGCSSSGPTCVTTSTQAGLVNYSVSGTNAQFGTGAVSSLGLNWTQSTTVDFCAGNSNAVRLVEPWGGLSIYPSAYGGQFGTNMILSVQIYVPTSPSSYGTSLFSAGISEYSGQGVWSETTLSRSSCDFRPVDPSGVSGPISRATTKEATVFGNHGTNMLPGQTWYVNVQWLSPFTCGGACSSFMGFQWPR